MTTQEALRTLGVRGDTLSTDEKAALDHDGYLPLYGIRSPDEAAQFAARLDALWDEERERAGSETYQERGSHTLADLVNKDPMFLLCFTHPRILAAVAHVLQGEFHFSSLNARAPLPGQGVQQIHLDYEDEAEPGVYYGCNTIWAIDAFTEENGPTRVVPGSHRSGKVPREEMDDLNAPHPREVHLTGPAGAVFVINAHTWHGGTRNNSDRPRRAMHAYFCRRDVPQQLEQRAFVRPETLAHLSEVERYLLDV